MWLGSESVQRKKKKTNEKARIKKAPVEFWCSTGMIGKGNFEITTLLLKVVQGDILGSILGG